MNNIKMKKNPSQKAFFKNFVNHKWIFLFSLIIGVLTIYLFYTNRGIIEIFQNFLYTSLPLFLLYLAISIIIQIFLVIRWKIIIKTHNHDVPFTKLWIYRTIGYGVSYFTPTAHVGGEPMRALLLKRYKVPFAKGLSTVLIDKSLELSMNSFFAIIGIFIILINYSITFEAFYIILVFLLILLFFILRFYYRLFEKGVFLNIIFDKLKNVSFLKKYINEIKTIREGILNFHDTNKKEFKISALISLILWFLMFAEYKVALLMIGYSATIKELFLIITVVGFAYLIPIPAALGILEVSQASIFRFLKIDVTKGIALSFLIRSRDLLISLIGMAFLFYKSFKFKSLFHDHKKEVK